MKSPSLDMSARLALCLWAPLGLAGCSSSQPAAVAPGIRVETGFRVIEPEAAEPTAMATAQAAKDAGEYKKALSLFRAILATNPTLTSAYLGIGDIFVEQKDYAAAEPMYARAARLEPRNFDAQYGHGLALQMLERFVEAVKAYHRALTIEPDSVDANRHLATTYLQMNEPDSALLFAEKAVEFDSASGAAHATLAAVYEATGRYDQAIHEYEAAVELMDTSPGLLMNLINVLGRQKRYVDARNTAEYLVRLAPSANAYERLGWACFRLGDYQQSLQAYRDAVKLDPTHWPSLNGVGCNALNKWLLSDKQDVSALNEARAAFRQSLKVNGNQPKVLDVLSKYDG